MKLSRLSSLAREQFSTLAKLRRRRIQSVCPQKREKKTVITPTYFALCAIIQLAQWLFASYFRRVDFSSSSLKILSKLIAIRKTWTMQGGFKSILSLPPLSLSFCLSLTAYGDSRTVTHCELSPKCKMHVQRVQLHLQTRSKQLKLRA